jgi:hypothetical protein
MPMKFDSAQRSCDPAEKSRALPRVPNYLGGRDRRNLTFWVLGGGFLLLIASNYSNFSKFAKAILPGQAAKTDTRVPLPPFREPLPYEAVQLLPLAEEAKRSSEQTGNPVPPAQKSPERKYYSAVNVALLDTIENEAPFRPTETEVWYHLFDVVNKASPEQLKKESTPIDNFATIYGQSNYYRGQAITLRGIARWYTEIKSDPPDNAAGIASFYEIGFAIDAYEDNPMVVYVVDLPATLPRGTPDPNDPARFLLQPGIPFACEGIFFKNRAYLAGDGEFRTMPALVAKTIRIQSAAAGSEPPTNPMVYLSVLLGLGVIFFLAMYLLAGMSRKHPFVISTSTSPLEIPELAVHDAEPKPSWPVLPEEQ